MCPIVFDWQNVRSILQEETKDVSEVYTYTVIKISNKHYIQLIHLQAPKSKSELTALLYSGENGGSRLRSVINS